MIRAARLVCVLLVGALPLTATAQEAPRIAGVTVEGNRFVDEATILAIAQLHVGERLDPRSDILQQAIRNLWQRRQFADVRIVVDKVTSLGVFLKIIVREVARFNAVEIRGNKEISLEKIKEAVGKATGDLLPFHEVALIRQRVLKLYEKEGLLFADVEADTVPAKQPGYVDVVLTITEGDAYKVRSVTFDGASAVPQEELLSALEENKPKQWWQFWRSATFDRKKFYEADVPAILRYYHSRGFIDADTVATTFSIDRDAKAVDITIALQEGKRYYLRTVRFEGNTIFPTELLMRRLDVEIGSPVNLDRIEKNINGNEDQTEIRSLYLDHGYLEATILYDVLRSATDSVDLIVRIYERERFTIRRVDIVGNTKTQDRVIRRELFTRPGDYFNRAAIIRSVKGLGVLNFFNPEKLRPDVRRVPGASNQVDLVYQVEERSTDVLNASIGYAGQFGLTGSIGVAFNNFDLSRPLFGGAGQVFSFQWDFGQGNRFQTFSVSFAEPWLFGHPTSVGFNVYDTRYFWNIEGRRTGGTINIGRRFRFPDDFFRGDWSLTYQRQVEYTQTLEPTRTFDEISILQTISRISYDNLIFPSSGSRFRWTVQASLGALGIGSSDFLKNEVQIEFVNPLLQIEGFDRLVMYLNTEFGNVGRIGNRPGGIVPLIQYYAMGGNGIAGINVIPLRGYSDRSVGVPGNNNLAYFRQTAELRFALSLNPMPIYVLAFAEAGNAWPRLRDADLFTLKRSAGLGMRILLNPIGLIGFDYGYGFDTDNITGTRGGWNFHIQFGNR
ncbi:MAG: outer membrane protein assembly factor BamA [Candidatus Kapaibacterium sp.]|nr:MAG: outer membrane protein assembly factor BamA [Candidatus Kapabacteria bacterium]